MVIRGIKEKGEDQPPETWVELIRVEVAKKIEKVCPDIDQNQAYDMVERANRSNKNKNYKGTASLPIFAVMTFWPDTVTVTEAFRKKNIKDRNHRISMERSIR